MTRVHTSITRDRWTTSCTWETLPINNHNFSQSYQPLGMSWSFIWISLSSLHPRRHCSRFGWNWSSVSVKEEQETHWRKRQNVRKPYLFPQKKFVSVFYVINIFNTIYYFKPTNFKCRENAFCKFHTFSGFVYHVSCLPWFESKNKIRCIDAPMYAIFIHRNLPESEKYIIWSIWNSTWSLDSFIWLSLVQPDTRLSPPLRRQSIYTIDIIHARI